jgi:Domain of unknown function (DUF4149)
VTTVLRLCYLLGLSVWIGEVIFFSFVVAPALFSVLGPAPAGDVVSVIFPRYYALGMGAATLTLASALALGRRATLPRLWTAASAVLALGLVATVIAGTIVHPRAQQLRAAAHAAGQAPADSEPFQRAHRLAVGLNGAALLAAVIGLGLSAAALHE